MKILHWLITGTLGLGLTACNDGSGDDAPLIEFPELDIGGVPDGSGDAFALPDGDDDCLLPCLFGSQCVDGQCVLPCEPACGAGATCQSTSSPVGAAEAAATAGTTASASMACRGSMAVP